MLGALFRLIVACILILVTLSVVAGILSSIFPLLVLLAPALLIYWYATATTRVPTHAPPRRARGRSRHNWWGMAVPTPTPEPNPAVWVGEAREIAAEIKRLVRRGDRATREALSGVPANAARLVERMRDLARSGEALDRHLRANNAAQAGQRAAEMRRRAQIATDSFVRDQYNQTAQSLESQAQVCAEMAVLRERVRAQMQLILATLAGMRSRIVATRSGMDAGAPVERAADELADLQAQVDNFHDSVRHVLNQARTTG